MTEKDKVPEKIDLEGLLGSEGETEEDAGEIEVLDPDSGKPVEVQDSPDTEAAGEGPQEDSAGAAPDGDAGTEAEQGKYYDLWLRTRADFENFRKRVARDRTEEESQAGAALVKDLLPVLDNLERALEGVSVEEDAFAHGVALILKQFQEILSRAGLKPIDAVGEPFDPVFHEAVSTRVTDEFEPNRVLEEVQKGYTFRGRVLRPSQVCVSVRPAEEAPSQEAASEEQSD